MFVNNEILVIDSDTHSLRSIKDTLLQNGFVVHFSRNCELAMQLALKNKPDLIISEMTHPDMDGVDFMRRVQKTPETSEIPFIFLSSRTHTEDKVAALESGADDYITKPFNEDELLARIKAVLRRVSNSRISTLTKDDGIKGSLKEINLLDLIQLFDMGRKTAVIEIQGSGKEGHVYFKGGEVVHAVCGQHFGKEALFEILAIREGTFLIHLHISSKVKTIDLSPTNLVMEAMYRMDENNMHAPVSSVEDAAESRPLKLPYSDGIKELFEEGVIEEQAKP